MFVRCCLSCEAAYNVMHYYNLAHCNVFHSLDSFYHSLSGEKLEKVNEYNSDHPGSVYPGVVFCKRLCGVSTIRSMENALRACCKRIKIGKILIHGEGNNGRQLIYEKLPADISSRQVLLLDPVLASDEQGILQ
ncbi:hypothetical protein K2173_024438 [Erythroxylum novogranatense]|uniref:Phosphoribosyltransferase domain-containing protein n=1 Tax=Erythroxylum novogranatense TaxID=1862640 RepID=A0AAV8SUK6_9ROSI|nr:hypothetical protein K2173_024438 [Erythroxylum novogranatense]